MIRQVSSDGSWAASGPPSRPDRQPRERPPVPDLAQRRGARRPASPDQWTDIRNLSDHEGCGQHFIRWSTLHRNNDCGSRLLTRHGAEARAAGRSNEIARVQESSGMSQTTRSAAAHGAAHRAAGRRELRRRVRHQQVVERLQLVQGRIPQPHPGQHGPADLHRPRGGPGLPRGISGAPRLQRPAGAAPGARPGLARVFRLSAVLAAIAHRRGNGQLRHRRRLPRRGADDLRARHALSAGRPRSRHGRRATPRCGTCSSSSATPATRRPAGSSTARSIPPGRRSLAGALRADVARARRAAGALHRAVPELRHQLQPRAGPGARVHREARRHRRSSRSSAGTSSRSSSPRRGCLRASGTGFYSS